MTAVSLPQARIPLGWVTVPNTGGEPQRLPVMIDQEWMRALLQFVARTGGVMGEADFGVDTFAVATDLQSGGEQLQSQLDVQQPSAVQQLLPDVMQPMHPEGIDASITTAGLVGKTITVTKGIITGFA